MRNAPQAVSVVTAAGEEGPRGITVSAFFSLSVDPPSFLISIQKRARAHAAIARGRFRIHLLAEDQGFVGRHFAQPGLDSREQFPDVPATGGGGEPPSIPDCLAWADCRVISRYEEADHTLFVGAVLASRVERPESRPLVYHRAAWRTVGAISQ